MIRTPAPAIDPGEVLRRLSRGERPFLLDGADDADGLGRYTFAGCDPDDGLVWRPGDAGDPLLLLDAAVARWRSGFIDSTPWPIAVGYLSYDLGVRLLETPERFHAVDDLGAPFVDFARYPAIWRWDRLRSVAELLSFDVASGERLLGRLQVAPPPLSPPRLSRPVWEISDDTYRARVMRIVEYLHAGDVYQVNLAHRLRATLPQEDALALFLRLRARTPAPLGAFLRTERAILLGNSPERFLSISPGRLETRPIKGTRGRGANPQEDDDLARALNASSKDRAEHMMVVDLERNDLGRIAEIGSVEVIGPPRHVVLPTVQHLVSTVQARTRPGLLLSDLLRAMLPGGSVTGAPKRRAMEIIDELEGVQRGPYCGAIGWLGSPGHGELALSIRTAVVRSGELILSVGGGIVADSTPDDELAETRIKAAAFLRAFG